MDDVFCFVPAFTFTDSNLQPAIEGASRASYVRPMERPKFELGIKKKTRCSI